MRHAVFNLDINFTSKNMRIKYLFLLFNNTPVNFINANILMDKKLTGLSRSQRL